MNLKIIYRSAVVWNVILHILMSFLFIFLQEAIYQEDSVFNIGFIRSISFSILPLLVVGAVSLFFIFNLKKVSKYFYILTVSAVSLYSAYHLISDFSKLILIVLFFYLLVSYYLYFLLTSELEQSYYNPGFSSQNLFDPMLLKINVKLSEMKTKKSHLGVLTNWDEDGCFVKLETPLEKHSQLELEILYMNHSFKQKVAAVTILKNKEGIGLKLKQTDNTWENFYKIISDMGMKVEYVK